MEVTIAKIKVKIERLEEVPVEVDKLSEELEKYFEIFQKSKFYKNRNSKYIRIYM